MGEERKVSLEENRWGRTPEEVAAGPAPEVVVPPTLLCPLTMNVCPGTERCAPAHFMAQHINRENSVSDEDGDEVRHANLVCPVAGHVLYLRMINNTLADMAAVNAMDEAAPQDNVSDDDPVPVRDRVIANLRLDD